MNRVAHLAALTVIVALGAALRLHLFTDVTTWFDESVGWRLSQCGPAEIIERSEQNVHPPLHFLLLSMWRGLFGGSLGALRSYALLWGILTIAGGYALADASLRDSSPRRRTAGALLAATLIACSGLHVHWSQQVKMYTLGTCLTVWSSWAMLRWFQSRGNGRLALYVSLAAALALQHHYGTFTVFAQLTFALLWAWRCGTQGDGRAVLVAGWGTFTLWSLWLPAFVGQRALVQDRYWLPEFTFRSLLDVWPDLFFPARPPSRELLFSGGVTEVVLLALIVLLVRPPLGGRWCAWLALVPYLCATLWSVLDENVLQARYLIFAHVCLLIGLAVLIASRCGRALGGLLTGVLLFASGWSVLDQRVTRTEHAATQGMPSVVAALQEFKSAKEPLLVCNPMLYLNFGVHNVGVPAVYAFDPGRPFPHFQGAFAVSEPEYRNVAALDAAGINSVWTLDAEKWMGGTWKVRLPLEWTVVEHESYPEWYATLILRRYERQPRAPAPPQFAQRDPVGQVSYLPVGSR